MKYNIIYIDPPWRYGNWTDKKNGAAKAHYDGLTIKELASLPIGNLAAANCAMFMWITHPKLAEGAGKTLFEAWGFRSVSTAFTWVKTNRNGSPYMGIGFYTRGDSELCLLGIKVSMKVKHKDVRQTIVSPRTKHSAKPNEETRRRIIRLFGDLPKIEIFARPPVPNGWDAIGYEVDELDIRESLATILGGDECSILKSNCDRVKLAKQNSEKPLVEPSLVWTEDAETSPLVVQTAKK